MDKKDFVTDYEKYYIFDLPIEVKGLKIYPVRLLKYYTFFKHYGCLLLEKNETSEGIRMSYLDFLFTIVIYSKEDGIPLLYDLLNILNLCLKTNIIHYDNVEELSENFISGKFFEDNVGIFDIKVTENMKFSLEINGIIIDKKDFDTIKSIILYQNIQGHNETYMHPDLKKELEERERLESSKSTPPGLEKQTASIAVCTGYEFEYIHNLTIRKFHILYQQCLAEIEYKIAKTASMSGMVEMKNPVKHWVFDGNDDGYSDKMMSLESIENKFASVT